MTQNYENETQFVIKTNLQLFKLDWESRQLKQSFFHRTQTLHEAWADENLSKMN